MKNAKNVFVGILAAATAGVVIGMLIAPKKGKHLRQDIMSSAGDMTKKFANLMEEGKEQLAGLKSMFGESAQEWKKEGKNLVNQIDKS